MDTLYTKLTPRLVVADAKAAIRFYQAVFDAEPVMTLDTPEGRVIHAEIDIGGMRLSLTESDGQTNRDPEQLGSSPVLLMWMCDDPDAVEARARRAGGTVIFPVDDRFYGMRDGRFADPSGHLWMVTKPSAKLSADELQRRVNAQM